MDLTAWQIMVGNVTVLKWPLLWMGSWTRRAMCAGPAFLAIAALTIVALTPAHARSDTCQPPGAQTVAELLQWIGGKTDYDVSRVLADPPVIGFCRKGQEIPYEDRTMVVEPNDQAIYDPVNRRIYLVGPWSRTLTRDLGILLHELVHDVQFRNRTWNCPNETEWEAYKLHEAWLAEHGIAADFDWVRIYFQSKCPRDIHP